jgi:hypothetical protein
LGNGGKLADFGLLSGADDVVVGHDIPYIPSNVRQTAKHKGDFQVYQVSLTKESKL